MSSDAPKTTVSEATTFTVKLTWEIEAEKPHYVHLYAGVIYLGLVSEKPDWEDEQQRWLWDRCCAQTTNEDDGGTCDEAKATLLAVVVKNLTSEET